MLLFGLASSVGFFVYVCPVYHGAAMTYDSNPLFLIPHQQQLRCQQVTKTLSGVINMDETKKIEYKPITENLKEMGYKIGVISSVPINHATPAAFYAKVPSRAIATEKGFISWYDKSNISLGGASMCFPIFICIDSVSNKICVRTKILV